MYVLNYYIRVRTTIYVFYIPFCFWLHQSFQMHVSVESSGLWSLPYPWMFPSAYLISVYVSGVTIYHMCPGLLYKVCHAFYLNGQKKHHPMGGSNSDTMVSPVHSHRHRSLTCLVLTPNLKVVVFPPGWLRGRVDKGPVVDQSVFPLHTTRLTQRPQE